ncbi:MAG: glycosyl hydrolase family 18 protein [Lachnospiraceae bacterium]
MDQKSQKSMRTRSNRNDKRTSNSREPDRNRSSASKGNSSRRRRRKRNLLIRFFLLFILIVGVIGTCFYIKKYGPSKEKEDLNNYYGIEKENQLAITIDNKVIGANAMTVDGRPYIEYAVVRDYLNSRFYWDPNENVLLYTLPNDIVNVGVGSKEYTISKTTNTEDYVILKTEGSTAYIAMDFVQKYTNLKFKVYHKPDRIMIVSDWGKTKTASIKKDTQVRYQGGVKSPILREMKRNEKVTVIENEGDWKKIRTIDGFIGYVKNSTLKGEKEETISREFTEEKFTSIARNYKINLAWHQVTNEEANNSILETIANTKGLTTLAPTWFSFADTQGNLNSIASSEYVNYAHQSRIEVWAVLNDFDGGINSNEETLEVLSYTSKRANLINQVVAEALQTGVDGINVDIEKVSEECGEHYIQFIRELSVKCRKNGIVLSVDNYVPKAHSAHYNRKEQGIVADYVIIMGYDEHPGNSLESGSVASYGFVKDGIEATLKEVPSKKVINAVPFYTRLWKEVPKTEAELASQKGSEEGQYTTAVSSEALGMEEAANRVAAAGITPTWDKTARQNYAQWDENGVTYKVWLEDSSSTEERLKLMKKNKLAGTAAWKLGFQNASIWDVILQYVN